MLIQPGHWAMQSLQSRASIRDAVVRMNSTHARVGLKCGGKDYVTIH